jgi:exopolyphosphatase/guanosine-5'-triphosphate,3'-diphosphate pyrophosphatase
MPSEDTRVLDADRAVADAAAFAADIGWAPQHQAHVADLALQLFDCIDDYHGLDADDRVLLHVAALAHDVGFAQGGRGHHRQSASMIVARGIDGLTPRGTAIAAATARYHRKAFPAVEHELYASLSDADRRSAAWLGGILRVADGLDRLHDSCVTSLRCDHGDDALEIICATCGDAAIDLAGGEKKGDLLEALLGRPVIVAHEGPLL